MVAGCHPHCRVQVIISGVENNPSGTHVVSRLRIVDVAFRARDSTRGTDYSYTVARLERAPRLSESLGADPDSTRNRSSSGHKRRNAFGDATSHPRVQSAQFSQNYPSRLRTHRTGRGTGEGDASPGTTFRKIPGYQNIDSRMSN